MRATATRRAGAAAGTGYTITCFADLLRLYLVRIVDTNVPSEQTGPLAYVTLKLLARSPPHPMNAELAEPFAYCYTYTIPVLAVLTSNKYSMTSVQLLALSRRAGECTPEVRGAIAEYIVEIIAQKYAKEELEGVMDILKSNRIADYCMLIECSARYIQTYFSLPESNRAEILAAWRQKQEGPLAAVLQGSFCSCP